MGNALLAALLSPRQPAFRSLPASKGGHLHVCYSSASTTLPIHVCQIESRALLNPKFHRRDARQCNDGGVVGG